MRPQPKPQSKRNKPYRMWIASLPCCVSGYKHPSELNDPHHVPLDGHGAKGSKTDDTRCIPLRHDLHVEAHNSGKISFAEKYGLDYELLIAAYNRLWEEKYGA